jgi:hypothetical protein
MNWKPVKLIGWHVKTIPAAVVDCALQLEQAPRVLLQIVMPEDERGHEALGATVLRRAWKFCPQTRGPARRVKRTSAEEHPTEAGGLMWGGGMGVFTGGVTGGVTGAVGGVVQVKVPAVAIVPTRGP